MELDKTKILNITSDMCIIETEELKDILPLMQNAWRKLIEIIDDDYIRYWLRCQRYVVCYGKWNWWL